MIKEFKISSKNFDEVGTNILNFWKDKNNKIVVLKSDTKDDQVRPFYENFCKKFGQMHLYGEDVNLGDRSSQRSDKSWMEVRFDPKIKNAYRHSTEAQPLHTDGSYIPEYPNATLMCCVSNSSDGGETIFLNSNDLIKNLEIEDNQLLENILQKEIIHERSGLKKIKKILYYDNDKNDYDLNWNYFCVSKNCNKDQKKMIENFYNYLNNSKILKKSLIKVKLLPGDAVVWKDHKVLHGRNSFKATMESERFLWKCAVHINEI
jgi:alpha-ketoglutarate-dependent taurine dioxygenase